MSKKLLMALACSVLLMGLAVCGSNDKASTSEEPKQETKKEEEQKKLEEQKKPKNWSYPCQVDSITKTIINQRSHSICKPI
ncbi:hypothetical protein [Bacillus thuringiensis]|uniref:hypothetical protein n=1 Tax=Bacillus thuringiensis TaxID=1428 RepID=UPI002D7EF05A|nr:hypothetical protein [Bacillus thuringiensis]MEB4816148.1 hypothetical protein [Bacillus thuringiensis]